MFKKSIIETKQTYKFQLSFIKLLVIEVCVRQDKTILSVPVLIFTSLFHSFPLFNANLNRL